MKRSPSRPQTLKHLPFFQVLADEPEGSEAAKRATAGLLALRMIDHWVLAGPAIVEPESVSVRSVRQAIMALPPNEPVRESLLTIVNTMQMVRHVDLVPVLPRVMVFAQLLERHHGELTLAADTYETVIRLGDPEYDTELVLDSYYRLAYCQRNLGDLDEAHETASTLVKLAKRRKDKARMLRGKVGIGLVTMLRGDLASADSQFVAVATEAERENLMTEFAMATHNRGVVAKRAGNSAAAVVLSHRALQFATDPVDRDRVLADLAAFLVDLGQYDAAIDALRILEVTAVSDEPRQAARVNLISAAARAGNRPLFDAARRQLGTASLSVETRVNLDIETARGLHLFGEEEGARALLESAEEAARKHGLEAPLAEIDSLRRAAAASLPLRREHADETSPTAEVVTELRRMAAALVSAA